MVGGITIASWWGYSTYTANERQEQALVDAKRKLEENAELIKAKEAEIGQLGQEVDGLKVEVKEKQIEIDRLDTALRLMKDDHRVKRFSTTNSLRSASGDSVPSDRRADSTTPGSTISSEDRLAAISCKVEGIIDPSILKDGSKQGHRGASTGHLRCPSDLSFR